MIIPKIHSGSFFENSFSILLTRMSLSCSSLIITIFIARNLGPGPLGLFSVAMALCTIFQYLSILGYDTIVIREIGKDQDQGSWLIKNGILLGVLSCAVGAVLMAIIGNILNYSPLIMKSVYLSSLVLFPCFLNVLGENIFIGLKKARFAFYTALVRETAWLVLGVWWLSLSHDINAVIGAFIVSRMVGVVFLAYLLQQEKISWWGDFQVFKFKEILGLIPAFFLINLLSNLLLEVDVVILSKLVSVEDVGFYNVTKKILRVSFILIFSMVSASFPTIVETLHKNHKMIYSYFARLSFLMLIVSFSIATSVYFLAHTLINLFLGAAFLPTVKFIQVLIWKIVPLSLSFLWSRFLIAANQQNKDVVALMIGLPLFFVLSIVFVKEWGTLGMAYADILTLICLAFIHLHFVKRTVLPSEAKI